MAGGRGANRIGAILPGPSSDWLAASRPGMRPSGRSRSAGAGSRSTSFTSRRIGCSCSSWPSPASRQPRSASTATVSGSSIATWASCRFRRRPSCTRPSGPAGSRRSPALGEPRPTVTVPAIVPHALPARRSRSRDGAPSWGRRIGRAPTGVSSSSRARPGSARPDSPSSWGPSSAPRVAPSSRHGRTTARRPSPSRRSRSCSGSVSTSRAPRRALARVRPDLRAEAGRLIPVPELTASSSPSHRADDPFGGARLVEGLGEVLTALVAGPIPGAIIVDDVNRADDSSLAVISWLARRLRGRPIILLVAWRAERWGRGPEPADRRRRGRPARGSNHPGTPRPRGGRGAGCGHPGSWGGHRRRDAVRGIGGPAVVRRGGSRVVRSGRWAHSGQRRDAASLADRRGERPGAPAAQRGRGHRPLVRVRDCPGGERSERGRGGRGPRGAGATRPDRRGRPGRRRRRPPRLQSRPSA